MADKLKRSFQKHNYVELVVVNADNMIVAGHQRIRTMKALGWDDHEIEVRVPNEQLSDEQVNDYLLTSNKVTGEFDFDMLSSHFDEEMMLDIGFTREDFGQTSEKEDEVEGIDPEEKLIVEVCCSTETEQREIFEELESRGLECRLLTL